MERKTTSTSPGYEMSRVRKSTNSTKSPVYEKSSHDFRLQVTGLHPDILPHSSLCSRYTHHYQNRNYKELRGGLLFRVPHQFSLRSKPVPCKKHNFRIRAHYYDTILQYGQYNCCNRKTHRKSKSFKFIIV